MRGLFVTAPIACFRKGLAREYLETDPLPPPATCYGFLLSLVGEFDRDRHRGARVGCTLLEDDDRGLLTRPSVVLRTVWRVKKKPLGSPGNTRPDFQQLHTHTRLIVWLDSSEEPGGGPTLEERVTAALADPASVVRSGGLCLGESTHLVDEVMPWEKARDDGRLPDAAHAFLLHPTGTRTLPVWVDHVGSAGTVYVTGEFEPRSPADPPPVDRLPRITDVKPDECQT